MECGGTTPLWIEQPEQPATDGTDLKGMGESRGRETTKCAKSAKSVNGEDYCRRGRGGGIGLECGGKRSATPLWIERRTAGTANYE